MNELRAMVEAYNRWRMGVPLVLATVVNVHGSAYRRPGARLLIAPSGAVGGLSAGYLEQDVVERGHAVLRSRKPVVVRYDVTLGVPALFGRRLFPELARLAGAGGARGAIRQHREEAVAVTFPQAGLDVDTPDAYRAIKAVENAADTA